VPAAARLLSLLLPLILGACSRPAAPPVLGEVPSFRLVERNGTPYGSAELRGHVWVADFIFTTCPDICPALTAQMRRLDELLPGDERPRRISITVDPTHDTPEVLRRYAAQHGVGSDWAFLTGDRQAVASLVTDGFHLAFADDGPPTQPITHSDRLVLVDPALRIRGYYHGRLDEDLQRLVRDVRALRAERAAAPVPPLREGVPPRQGRL
jgi:protein SCO1/2